MKIVELDISECLSSSEFDPSPHRVDPTELSVSERRNFPTLYQCDSCNYKVSFRLKDFINHTNIIRTNLETKDFDNFHEYIVKTGFEIHSSLDFYCPNCKQAAMILFVGGPSGLGRVFCENSKSPD